MSFPKRMFGAHTPVTSKPSHDGEQHLFEFPNGRKASVIRHMWSQGHELGLWELAVMDANCSVDYSTPITDDVLGDLSETDVATTLDAIAALPQAVQS